MEAIRARTVMAAGENMLTDGRRLETDVLDGLMRDRWNDLMRSSIDWLNEFRKDACLFNC